MVLFYNIGSWPPVTWHWILCGSWRWDVGRLGQKYIDVKGGIGIRRVSAQDHREIVVRRRRRRFETHSGVGVANLLGAVADGDVVIVAIDVDGADVNKDTLATGYPEHEGAPRGYSWFSFNVLFKLL